MMKKIFLLQILITLLLLACNQHKSNINPIAKKINRPWLDSIIKNSDSSFIKPYKRSDFVTAVFYITKKDSTVCQIMKDSVDSIRQIIIAKKDRRSFFAQYFANGNLQADLPLDEFGQYHGTGKFYYEDGNLQSSGNYTHGLKSGSWKVYDEKGKLINTDNFDKNGQLIQAQQP